MADEVIDRLEVQIVGDTTKYNGSIDAAVARTKSMQVQQKKLVEDLDKNAEAQKRTAMSIEKTSAKYGVNSDKVQDLTSKLQGLKNSEQALGKQLSSINKTLDGHQKKMNETATSTNQAKNSMSGFVKVLATAATGYVGKKFLEATIGSLAEFEQYETSFAVMLGDMGKAKALMGDLEEFSKVTPFGMTDVTKASTLLMNYGVEAEKLIPTMTQLGNLSQGNADKLDRISLAYGQMLAKGKVTGEELRQMTEAGVPLNKALAESIGISTAELAKMLEKGQVGIPQLNQAIEDLTTGNGKFAGMMEQQSKTLLGMWSTAKDEISSIARELGEEAFVEVKDGLSDMLDEVASMRESGELSALAKDLGGLLADLTKGFIGVTKVVVENKEVVGLAVISYGAFKVVQQVATMQRLFTTAINATTVAQKAMNVVAYANPYVAVAGALTAIIGTLVMFGSSTSEAEERVKSLNEEMENLNNGNIFAGNNEIAELKMVTEQTIPKIEQLSKTTHQTAGEKELLKKHVEDLNNVLGYEAVDIDNVTESLVNNRDEIYANITALENKAKADAVNAKIQEEYAKRIDDEIELANAQIEKTQLVKQQAEMEIQFKITGIDTPEGAKILGDMEGVIQKTEELNHIISEKNEVIQISNDYISDASNLLVDYETAATGATSGIDGFWNAVDGSESTTFVSDVKSMSDTLNVLTTAQKECDTTNKFSVETLQSLAKEYPQLAMKVDEYSLGLINSKELVDALPQAYEDEKQAYVDNLKTKLASSEKFYKQNILSQTELIAKSDTLRHLDLGGFTTLAEAKREVESTLIGGLDAMWKEYYVSVGGNATKTVLAMQKQISELNLAKNTLSVSMDPNASKTINDQIKDIENIIESMKPLTEIETLEFNVDYSGIEANFDKLLNQSDVVTDKVASSAEDVEKILKDTYDEQLNIAQDYLNERKKQIDDEYTAKIDKINEGFDADKKALDSWYQNQKEQVQSSIDAIDELIQAKQKAREDEKLEDNLSSTQTKITNLQTQITYSRSPEEKAELEKELARQQEELKDLTVQKEVGELEAQKKVHEDDFR